MVCGFIDVYPLITDVTHSRSNFSESGFSEFEDLRDDILSNIN